MTDARRNYYSLNRESILAKAKVYYLKNKQSINKKHRDWSRNNNTSVSRNKSRYYLENKTRIKTYRQSWHKNNRERLLDVSRQYHSKHRDRLNAISREYYQLHKKEINDATKKRRKTDENFRLKLNLSSRIRTALRANSSVKSDKTRNLIGCDIDFLKEYLQARFGYGMSWNNYGQWHVDHVIPCSAFDLTNPDNQKSCFHYSNLRPLWGIDNQRKNARLPQVHQADLI